MSAIAAGRQCCNCRITVTGAVIERIDNFATFLTDRHDGGDFMTLPRNEIAGRAIGSPDCLAGLEKQGKRPLKAKKLGPRQQEK